LARGTWVAHTGLHLPQRRQSLTLSAIAPDGSKIYVGGAGSDFRVYDATTLKLLKVVEFDGEIQGQVFVVDA
jgi:hypothetical protein